ncbi:MAG: MarR family transcriptional regulator [Woeseiaceae bacterium]|nr:MarR family transcriptional regulator [Woeseiaceae bacterium]
MQKDSVDLMLSQWQKERPDLDTSALAATVRVLILHKRFLRLATDSLAEIDLELWEYDVLSALRRQGPPFKLSASELAETTALSAGAMTNRIDKLVQKQLVRREADPDDRRGVIVGLTRKGIGVTDKAIQLRLEAANRGVRSLNKKERIHLASLLRRVVIDTRQDR